MQCGLYDLTEDNEIDRFKTYDLTGILSNLEIELWTEAAFMRSIEATAARLKQPVAKGRFSHCLAFMKLNAYREERLNWRFQYPGDLADIASSWKVQVLKGFEIWQPENRWAGEINRKLRNQYLVSYIIPRPTAEVRVRLRLPMHFQLYPICDRSSIPDRPIRSRVANNSGSLGSICNSNQIDLTEGWGIISHGGLCTILSWC